ncbi:unnamed protein product [Linum tenue]|uniref:Uncharacterized protein n=1 Tax=Linum tenue TaxID=586396 RepID=A0AAV0P1M8_9ROSI|nr:unnamed protein product [Linum tenue]
MMGFLPKSSREEYEIAEEQYNEIPQATSLPGSSDPDLAKKGKEEFHLYFH